MSPNVSSFGRWWAWIASSTASGWRSNSRLSDSNSSADGSYRPIHANAPSFLQSR